MPFDPFEVNAVHLAYAILGGFVCVFSLISLFIKEKLYIGEATVATIVGIIFGPVALNLFNPFTWGNTDQITLELARVVLIVQVFAVGVELPKAYMWRHWKSLAILLGPVMAYGWLISSAFIYWLIPALNFVDALCVGACVTATDPVLASSVVGKGKFAKRVPGHLRNLLSAESGSNDGMAFPFLYIALYIILDNYNAGEAVKDFVLIAVLYEVVLGTVLGAVIGIVWRKAIKFCERRRLIDRESFLSFYFVLAIFCTGVGTLLGTDDLLVSFAAGSAFAWDGWFTKRTEESHVSNVIDLLFNLSFFVYYGSIIPWSEMNSPVLTIVPWRLVVIAILILLFRRIPIMLAFKPIIPDIRSWREALFCGHFGPIGVGAIFISILARAELETGTTVPLADLPTDPSTPNYILILAIWPIVSFLILSSIIVHGSSIAVFTLGKRLNTLSFTITYTQDNATTQASAHSVGAIAARFPRLSITSRKPPKAVRKEDISAPRDGHPLNADTLIGQGGPISISAIGRTDINVETAPEATRRREARRAEMGERSRVEVTEETLEEKVNDGEQAWREGDEIFIENEEGEIIRQISSPRHPAGEMKYLDEEGRLTDRLKRMWSGGSHNRSRSPDRARTPRALEEGIPEESHVQEKDFAGTERSSVSSETETPPRDAHKPAVVGPVIVVDEDNRLAPSISPREARRAREERDEETEVERRRREAIFGGIADDSDDEDRPVRHRNKGKSLASPTVRPPSPLISAVVDSDDDENGGEDDRSPSGSSGNAESSSSGTGLLSPPARARGIRFGDINVGTESFSLEEGPPSTGGPTTHRRTGSSSSRVRWNK